VTAYVVGPETIARSTGRVPRHDAPTGTSLLASRHSTDWTARREHLMTTTTVHTPGHGPGPDGVRRIAGALCLPALFVALLATGPLDPFDDQAAPAVQLRQVPGHVGLVRALGWVELVSAALAVGVVLCWAGLTRGRGRGVANVGVVLGALGSVGLALVGVHHWVLAALDGAPGGAAALTRLDEIAGPGIVALMFATPVALLLFTIAGFRAGLVPVPVLVLMVLFMLGELTPGLPGGELVPLVVGLVAQVWTAVALLRGEPAAAPVAQPALA
jgi:hypothetical protein